MDITIDWQPMKWVGAWVWPVVLFAAGVAQAENRPTEPAIGGYCPVSYFTVHEAVKGNSAHQAVHAGQLYYFADDERRKKFVEDPIAYLPQFDALCTTALGGSYGNRLPSNPDIFDVREGRLYLFSSLRAKNAYLTKPELYITQGNERFEKPAFDGICLVASRRDKKAVPGHPRFAAPYNGWVYRFVDDVSLAAFLADPNHFLPQYEGFCAQGVANGKRFPADGSRLRVVENKTFFLFDAGAEREFDADPAKLIREADAQWPTVKTGKGPDK